VGQRGGAFLDQHAILLPGDVQEDAQVPLGRLGQAGAGVGAAPVRRRGEEALAPFQHEAGGL
jgi:hypothetical protein